jgi:Tfp pilus assembly protein PilE
MNYNIEDYEDKQMATVAKWFVGIFVVIVVAVFYQVIVNGYQPTGKKSELMSIEATIYSDEKVSSFFVRIAEKDVTGRFSCRSEPIKKRATIYYRMTEVKTVTGKFKTVPIVDGELSCKSVVSDVKLS